MSLTHDVSGKAEQPGVDDRTDGRARGIPGQLLRLSVQRPAPGVRVVRVQGEVDMLTAPLLDECLQRQLGHAFSHLVVDLKGVSYLGCSGLCSLLQARKLAQSSNVGLYLTGLAKKAVSALGTVAALLPMFRCYRTLSQALAALLDRVGAEPSDGSIRASPDAPDRVGPSPAEPSAVARPAEPRAVPRAPGDERTDTELMSRIAAGDHRALRLLYGRYVRPAYSLARRICVDAGLAEDVIQEVFLAVWCGASRYDPARGRFATWLLTVVHHKSVDAVRRESVVRRRTVSSSDEGEDWSVPPGPGVDEVAIGSVQAAQVRAALARLPVEQRQTLILSYFDGYSQGQIAALTKVPLGTVKSRMFAGVQRLRILLDPLVDDLSSADLTAGAAREDRGSSPRSRRTDTCQEASLSPRPEDSC